MKPDRISNHPEVEMPGGKEPKTMQTETTWLPLKRILCPVDQTPVSTSAPTGAQPDCVHGHGPTEAACRALRTAEELAGLFCAELLLVHVVPPTPVPQPPIDGALIPPFDVVAYEEQLREHYQTSLEQLREERLSHDTKARVRVVTGDPATEIVRMAKEEKSDLIVLPTHGRSGLSHVFFGSVAEKVVRHAECPVLTLH
ncbi:MAG TPA: universal stress protein [bacterium]|nr:universal stress protein [bacterium]